jgi:hypothetical protein
MKDIIFTDVLTDGKVVGLPKPANSFIPDWYKKIESYVGGKKVPSDYGQTSATIKKCIPVFDAITAGYIIVSPCDVYVEQKEGVPFFKWSGFDTITFHPITQTIGHPATKDGFDSPKWMNPWAIKTPKGYSVLIVSPMHRDLPFEILPGIVDTDTYSNPINFPFKLLNPKWEGLIPVGTPIAQVIPFKREPWNMKLGGEKELTVIKYIQLKSSTAFFDKYKKFWWHSKEYK